MQTTVFRHHITHTVFIKHTADDFGISALGHFNDAALGSATTIGTGNTDEHTVAMQRLFHLAVIQKDVSAFITANRGFRPSESEAIWMAFNAAGNQVGLVRQDERTLAVTHELALALHGTNATLKGNLLILVDSQLGSEGRFTHRTRGRFQRLHHVFTGWQRVFVLLFFPFVKRVESTYFGNSVGIL